MSYEILDKFLVNLASFLNHAYDLASHLPLKPKHFENLAFQMLLSQVLLGVSE